MKTHFRIESKEFVDYLRLTVNNKTYYFCDEITVELENCEALDVEIAFVRAEEYLKTKAKNRFLKRLLTVAKWIVSPVMYFADNDDEPGWDKGYSSFNPFSIKRTFRISSPDEKTVSIHYIEAKYNKMTKEYAPPAIEVQGENISDQTGETAFSETVLRQEWKAYHIPAFVVIMTVILLLNVLNFSIFATVIREIPLYTMAENIGGIVGMSLSSLAMIAMFVAECVVVVKAYRLQKAVIKKNM